MEDLRDAAPYETSAAPFDQTADVDAVLVGGVGAREHARRHARVIEVFGRVDEDHLEAAAGQFRRSAQGEEVCVSAAGEGYRRPVGSLSHPTVIYREKSMFTGCLDL